MTFAPFCPSVRDRRQRAAHAHVMAGLSSTDVIEAPIIDETANGCRFDRRRVIRFGK